MPHQRRRLGVAERREEILAAARHVFSTTPYSDASTQHIAETCGASQGLIFHYFGSKSGLYTAFLEDSSRSLASALRAALQAHPRASRNELLTQTLEIYLDYIAASPLIWAAGRRGGEEPTETINFRIAQRDVCIEELRESLSIDDAAGTRAVSGFLGFLDAICLDWVDEGCPGDQRGLIIATASGALTGALAGPNPA
ncbi:TetR/AcrR family transcriptional regulator [Corynebacterium liangguodongii]|nr:TetR/AcrR family transcriptional regulator [Corynebacterium liangguodongii]